MIDRKEFLDPSNQTPPTNPDQPTTPKLKQFQEYKGNDFYLTSESYGGHYLPTTTQYILSLPGNAAQELNFKGFFLGNPWTDPATNAVGRVQVSCVGGACRVVVGLAGWWCSVFGNGWLL